MVKANAWSGDVLDRAATHAAAGSAAAQPTAAARNARRSTGEWYTLCAMTSSTGGREQFAGSAQVAGRDVQTLQTAPDPLMAVALVSGTLLMTELALTRIFSVVMYYHFAFLAISLALFGLSASGVYAYVARHRLDRRPTSTLLARQSVVYAVCTPVSLFVLVRLQVGLNYTPRNLQ